jgi:UDP-N-acetylmuramoyl-L-alanyl-D-glutamate--2,6-diaminopimelate ligase
LTTDGHLYAKQAYENGARAFIVEHIIPDLEGTQIVVEDSRSAMSVIASQFYGNPANKLRLIGITGTNGKTSVTYMIQSIAKACGYRCGVVGTLGIVYGENQEETGFTTPDPIELQAILAKMVEHKMDWVAMEVSAHALDLRKLCGVTFDVAAFTNLTQDHLDHFGDMENYFAAKRLLFSDGLARNATVNVDEETAQDVISDINCPLMTYGISTPADLFARDIEITESGVSFTLNLRNLHTERIHLLLTGMFNVYNALVAAACLAASSASLLDCFFMSMNTPAHTPSVARNAQRNKRMLRFITRLY